MNFDVECIVFHFWNSFFVCVCMRRWIIMAQSSPKMHFSKFQILKFSRWKPPVSPLWEGEIPIPYPPPTMPAACGRRWSALLRCSDGYSISFSFYLKIWGEPCTHEKYLCHSLGLLTTQLPEVLLLKQLSCYLKVVLLTLFWRQLQYY